MAEAEKRKTRQRAFRALHRLQSIVSDVDSLRPIVSSLLSTFPSFSLLPNERCGAWYMPQSLLHPTPTSTRCYFKSTDGHVNIHDFSTQRLNLPLFNLASITGGVVLVDSTKSSKKKSMPDSFSRTIPLWPPLWEGPEDVDLGENGAASGYFYSPGAGDDHEGWARGLTPAMFWDHHEEILRLPRTEDSVDSRIDHIVKSYPKDSISQGTEREYDDGSYDKIGDSGIYVGSRSSGRPPGCWERFDAIVNVTMNEYENMADTIGTIGKHYLCCPVEEGKRDKTELEKWLPVVLLFFGIHGVSRGGKVLIHCAQGKDRSVAIAMVCLAVFGDKRELALEEGWYSENELVPPARLSRS
ncbi:hypothetical protein TrCOL_g7987 [Triparma columacea]|uniref:Tyrosine specific protein phosphatases domain-containing protein n=1 Tax=Triparma columacea TaxID=722753 RepID=A0A9W7LEZ1_9STRA|nr:hypothetical protein TrCOL_g7987 [Triparma columacea]